MIFQQTDIEPYGERTTPVGWLAVGAVFLVYVVMFIYAYFQ